MIRRIALAKAGVAPTDPKTLAMETPSNASYARVRQQLADVERQRDILKTPQPFFANRIRWLMREPHLWPKQKRRILPRTTGSRDVRRIAENRLAKVPARERPGMIWQSGFTYTEARESWLYSRRSLRIG